MYHFVTIPSDVICRAILRRQPVSSFCFALNDYLYVHVRQPHHLIYSGYLFGIRALSAELVLVPLETGSTSFITIDDLDISYWIPPGLSVLNVRNHAASRIRFEAMPGTAAPLPTAFTIYFQPQCQCARRNRALETLLNSRALWKGTVLVVKHGLGETVVDMLRSDISIVSDLVVA